MAKNFLWITKTDENLRFYSDSATKSNLALRFATDIDSNVKKKICEYVRYLRKEFYFPIRCNVYFCDQERFRSQKGGYCYGIFSCCKDDSVKQLYPQIYIPARTELYSIYYSLNHELTHYFQWYFLDDKTKSDRSLEIQAAKYAARISEDYCNYYCKEPDEACKGCHGK